jgi:hypothetical protein
MKNLKLLSLLLLLYLGFSICREVLASHDLEADHLSQKKPQG